MKSNTYGRKLIVGGMGLLFLALGSGASVFAGGAVSATPLTFTESMQDKEVCPADNCTPEQPDTFSIKATVPLTGVDISTFGPTTGFQLNLGNFGVTNMLGDDPKFIVGKSTKATIISTELNDNGKTVTYLTVLLKWTTKLLTVSVAGKTSDLFTSALVPILATNFDGFATHSIMTNTVGTIDFDTLSLSYSNVSVTGSVVTKQSTAKDGSIVNLSKVTLKGTATGTFVTAP